MTLNDYCKEALRIANEHGFTDATSLEDMALIHSEVSEAVEEIRMSRKPNEVYYEHKNGSLDKPCGVPSELADVVIRVMHFCGKHEIDLDKILRDKMAYNETRAFKHGKTL
jgi:NTP pyrophosphatase (non-canonical NTP hydrolase)